jgi:hypothetical protein
MYLFFVLQAILQPNERTEAHGPQNNVFRSSEYHYSTSIYPSPHLTVYFDQASTLTAHVFNLLRTSLYISIKRVPLQHKYLTSSAPHFIFRSSEYPYSTSIYLSPHLTVYFDQASTLTAQVFNLIRTSLYISLKRVPLQPKYLPFSTPHCIFRSSEYPYSTSI